MSDQEIEYWVYWCGSACAGNPHPTREAAEDWIQRSYDEAKAAKVPFYGHYSIEPKPKGKRNE